MFIADGDDFFGATEFQKADVAEWRLNDNVRLVDMQAGLRDARFHDVDRSQKYFKNTGQPLFGR